jgi:hypothetical protein
MNYFKSFIEFLNEQYDTPELKGTFTPKDIRGVAFAQNTWSGTYRKFQYGTYGDKPSGELNDLIGKAHLKDSDYAISDYLYSLLKKYIPDFKDYKLKNYDDFNDGRIGIWLKKEVKLTGTRFNAESEIWVYYHSKSNKWLDKEKGKIYVLFVCGLRPTKKGFDLVGETPNDETREKDIKQAFTDIVNDNEGIDDKKLEIFLRKISELGYGHPDAEDKNIYKKLEIMNKNLSISSFIELLPKIKNNIDHFKKYIKNKYDLSFL